MGFKVTKKVVDGVEVKIFTCGSDAVRTFNLRELGFDGRVSDAARAEIKANEDRAFKVLTTAHLYLFR